jgi:pSer/pThr/pTyr-binding forkhead associated (FHA) protein
MDEAGNEAPRVWLRVGASEIPLSEEWVTAGRSEECGLVLDDSFVSRQHARFVRTSDGVLVEDLSTNGVFVDGERIERRRVVDHGSIVTIGNFEIEVVIDPGARVTSVPTEPPPSDISSRPPTVRPPPPVGARASVRETTSRADAIALLIPVAHRLLDEGRVDGAERLMSSRLNAILEEAKLSKRVNSNHATGAARLAIRLAAQTSRSRWLEYAFELCAINPDLMSRDAIDELYSLVRQLPPMRLGPLHRYIECLERISNRLNPGDRFVLQRLRGLAKLAESL